MTITSVSGMDSASAALSFAGSARTVMEPEAEALFLSSLDEIERAARFVARRAGLSPEDGDDLTAAVKLRLIENDYAVLRRFGGRCSLATYVASVAHRLCADEWMHVHGRFRPSAEAKRLGETAILLETLLVRDGLPLDDAVALARRADPALTRAAAETIAARLPERASRAQLVPMSLVQDRPAEDESAERRVIDAENAAASDALNAVVRETLRTLSAEDRVVLQLRFSEGLRVADIARMLGIDQKQLYRRLDAMARTLRDALTRAGIDSATAQELIGGDDSRLNFDLHVETAR